MKEEFNKLITETVKPLLKANGFGKKGLNFYKRKDEMIFLFNFQNSQGNTFDQTKFYINCGIHSSAIDKVIKRPELAEPKEYDCHFRDRISSICESTNDGYFISKETVWEPFTSAIIADLETVISMFDKINSTNDLTNLMIEKNGLNNYCELFEYLLLTENKIDLKRLVKLLHQAFEKDSRWPIFEKNLSKVLIQHKRTVSIKDILKE